jgi:hypothetical protein
MLVIGLVLAVGAVWAGLAGPNWPRMLPVLLIGLSLMSFGWSAWSKARRAERER